MKVIRPSEIEGIVTKVPAGEVTRRTIVSEGKDNLEIGTVNFSKGATNDFSVHAFDQVLYITEGSGILATETGEITVTKGMFVFIPAGEKHRHGSTKDSTFAHITIKCS